ncbi:MAG: hypothetical protein WD035_00795, partial [Balneolaceae bacterium]
MNVQVEQQLTVRERLIQEAKKEEKTNGFIKPNYLSSAFQKLHIREYRGKRLFDLMFGFFALIVFLIATPFIALGIKLSSPG